METIKMERSETGINILRFTKPKMADIGVYTCKGPDASIEIRVGSMTFLSR